jgi:hypothetical protein
MKTYFVNLAEEWQLRANGRGAGAISTLFFMELHSGSKRGGSYHGNISMLMNWEASDTCRINVTNHSTLKYTTQEQVFLSIFYVIQRQMNFNHTQIPYRSFNLRLQQDTELSISKWS